MVRVTPVTRAMTSTKNRQTIGQTLNKAWEKTPMKHGTDLLVDGLANTIGWAANKKPVQAAAKALSKIDSFRFMSGVVGVTLSSFYIRETLKSKKIEPEQKRPLAINQAMVGLVSLVGSYTIDNTIEKRYDNFTKTYLKVNEKTIGKNAALYEKGLKNAKTLIVFALVYRYFVPVFITPFANKLSALDKKKLDSKAAANGAHNKA